MNAALPRFGALRAKWEKRRRRKKTASSADDECVASFEVLKARREKRRGLFYEARLSSAPLSH